MIGEYAVGMITYDYNMRQLLQPQGKDLCATENGITCQEYGRSGEPSATLRLDVPGLQGSKVIFARSNLSSSCERRLVYGRKID